MRPQALLAQLPSKDASGIAQFGKGKGTKGDAKKMGFVEVVPGAVRCGGPVSNLNACLAWLGDICLFY